MLLGGGHTHTPPTRVWGRTCIESDRDQGHACFLRVRLATSGLPAFPSTWQAAATLPGLNQLKATLLHAGALFVPRFAGVLKGGPVVGGRRQHRCGCLDVVEDRVLQKVERAHRIGSVRIESCINRRIGPNHCRGAGIPRASPGHGQSSLTGRTVLPRVPKDAFSVVACAILYSLAPTSSNLLGTKPLDSIKPIHRMALVLPLS